jgi:hypothetical protein
VVELPEPAVDLARRLRRRLEPAVDLLVELAETPVQRRAEPFEPTIDLGVPLGQLRAEGAREPDAERADGAGEEDDRQCRDHGPRTLVRASDGKEKGRLPPPLERLRLVPLRAVLRGALALLLRHLLRGRSALLRHPLLFLGHTLAAHRSVTRHVTGGLLAAAEQLVQPSHSCSSFLPDK